jgi:hypothetical protein
LSSVDFINKVCIMDLPSQTISYYFIFVLFHNLI